MPNVFLDGWAQGTVCHIVNHTSIMYQISELESDRQEVCDLLLGGREMKDIFFFFTNLVLLKKICLVFKMVQSFRLRL